MNDSFQFQDNFDPANFNAFQGPADGCTQCGICISSCPTYQATEDLDQSPMGRIRLIRQIEELNNSQELKSIKASIDSCVLCRTCEKICPSKVNFTQLRDQALVNLKEFDKGNWKIRLLLSWAEQKKDSFPSSIMKLLFQSRLTLFFINLLQVPRLVGLSQTFRGIAKDVDYSLPVSTNKRSRVILFDSCVSEITEPQVQKASVAVLSFLGMEILSTSGLSCCGSLHRHNGEPDSAIKLARENLDTFGCKSPDAIITNATGCGKGIKDYPLWFESEHETKKAQRFASLTWDICDFINDQEWPDQIKLKSIKKRILVHTPCSRQESMSYVDPVPALLQTIPDLVIEKLSVTSFCCGAGGSHLISHPEQANSIREKTLMSVIDSAPDILVTTNTGCALHLRAGLKERVIDIPVMHPVEILAQAVNT